MIIPDTVASRLAHFLGVPRKYAVKYMNRWSRRHDDLSIDDFIEKLNDGPLCVSLRNSNGINGEMGYTGHHKFILFDIDSEDNFDGAKQTTIELVNAIKDHLGYDSLVTFSGKKGFHIWVFSDIELHHTVVYAWQHDLITSLSYTQTEKINVYTKDGVNVDTLITLGANDGYVVKVPWSRHQSREGFYEFPIAIDDILDFDKETPPTEEQWRKSIEVFEQIQQVEGLLVMVEAGGDEIALPTPTRRERRPVPRLPPFSVPETDEDLPKLLEAVNSTPCLKRCMDQAMHENGVYWERATLVSILAVRGFSRETISVFFRDVINNDEDNRNMSVLEYQVNYWYNRRGICSCRVLRNPQSRFRCCSDSCGRRSPASPEPPLRIPIPPVDDSPIPETIDGIYHNDEYKVYQIHGTTRSRKTTETVLGGIRNSVKTTIVVPRLAILKNTGRDILERARDEHGYEVYSCYLPDNRQTCLRLAQDVKLIRRQHNIAENELSAFEMLNGVERPKCKGCHYENNYLPEDQLAFNTLYGESDIENDICGYQTILQYSHLWNIVWTSDKKFLSIAQAQGTRYETPLMGLIADTGAYIMDEIAHFVENSSFEVDVRKIEKEDPHHEYRFTRHLRYEILIIEDYLAGGDLASSTDAAHIQRANELRTLEREISDELRNQTERLLQDVDTDAFIYRRDITEDEMKELQKVRKHVLRSVMIQAKYDNKASNAILNALSLSMELEWIFTNIPNEKYKTNISLKIAPKIGKYVSYLQESGAKVIALDATPPVVPLEDVFERPVKKINIGDPQGTNDKFIIIPDSKNIYASKLGKPANINRLKNWIRWAVRLFGEDILGTLTTNIKYHNQLRDEILTEFPNVGNLYHRGEQVIGVAYDKRIGISICAPLAPKNVAHWLKLVYTEALAHVSAYQLWKHEQGRQTQQAEARFKDPQAVEPSVVFAFGQTADIVKDSYTNAIVKPKIAKTIWQRGGENECPIQLIQGVIWHRNQQVIDEPKDLKAILSIMRGKDDEEVQNNSRCSVGRISELREVLELVVPEVLETPHQN